jgi:hypothetical protein
MLRCGRARRPRSGLLNRHKRVAGGVAQPERRRLGTPQPGDFGVHVHPALGQPVPFPYPEWIHIKGASVAVSFLTIVAEVPPPRSPPVASDRVRGWVNQFVQVRYGCPGVAALQR